MEKILVEILCLSRKLFQAKGIDVWYVKLGTNSWRCFIINTINKVIVNKGPLGQNARAAVVGMRDKMNKMLQNNVVSLLPKE
jgi:hypothetical protein